ncbi:hypothetical protein ACFC1T_09250 [Kitasatospora sp. NPDC056076]|uniref:hypothetical protein n=1 Tax=Kitasatospora sp. NPDC056076 TaxID=3345703 RepID=UPI0035D743C1
MSEQFESLRVPRPFALALIHRIGFVRDVEELAGVPSQDAFARRMRQAVGYTYRHADSGLYGWVSDTGILTGPAYASAGEARGALAVSDPDGVWFHSAVLCPPARCSRCARAMGRRLVGLSVREAPGCTHPRPRPVHSEATGWHGRYAAVSALERMNLAYFSVTGTRQRAIWLPRADVPATP